MNTPKTEALEGVREPGFVRPANYDTVSPTPALAAAMNVERLLVVMQAAVIETRNHGSERGMAWIANTLCGPGLLPDFEPDAQAYFDLHAPSLDACAFTSAEAAVPRSAAPGWALVPVEPTKAMQDAWDTAPFSEDTDVEFGAAYRAMLAAAHVTASQGQEMKKHGHYFKDISHPTQSAGDGAAPRSLDEQIARAKAEVAKWIPARRAGMRLQGGGALTDDFGPGSAWFDRATKATTQAEPTVAQLAALAGVKALDVMMWLAGFGVTATLNQSVDSTTMLAAAISSQLAARDAQTPPSVPSSAVKDSLTVADPVDPVPLQKRCSTALRLAGSAYPRTCYECKLGPCKFFSADSQRKAAGS